MPLLADELTLWEVGLRWAGRDSYWRWPWLPLQVRDNFRVLLRAILHDELNCDTLSLAKWQESDGEDLRPYFIRHHLTQIHACIQGRRFSRQLLRWAVIDRWDFMTWCERQGVPLPEFWFPPGWKLTYEQPQDEFASDAGAVGSDTPAPLEDVRFRPDQRRRIACQEIATALWKDSPETTIADMVKDPHVRKLGGAMYQSEATVRRWLSAVAPAEVKAKRGRPSKKRGVELDS
jgi:hypothetical protein